MTAPKVLEILHLFTADDPRWRVERIACALGVSPSTAYRCVAQLVTAGFLEPIAGGSYVLGPAFIEFDRRMRISDELLIAAAQPMARLGAHFGVAATVVLARYYRDCVMYVHSVRGDNAPRAGYDRGQPIPLFRSAAARAILSALPERQVRRLHRQHAPDIEAAGLGRSTREFVAVLRALRETGWAVAASVTVPGRYGVAAPIVVPRGVLGSVTVSLPYLPTLPDEVVGPRVVEEARLIAAQLGDVGDSPRLIARGRPGARGTRTAPAILAA